MKTTGAFITALFIIFASTVPAAPTAQATLFCWSLRFQQGEGSFDETLDFSTTGGAPNGELAPWYSTYTHSSGFSLDFSGLPITGTIYLNLPSNPDANGNGFDDSFEVSQAVGGTSQGQYTTAIGGGTVSATWSRAAGLSAGTCWLRLVDNTYGDLGTFRHTFEVLEFTGLLTYTPGSSAVSGNVNLTNATDQLQGPVSFTKSVSSPHNELTLETAFLTNSAQQTFSLYETTAFFRDTVLITNYYGAVILNDGDLNTVAEDYFSWELSLDDANDSDHDGIPDFSDELSSVVPPRPPLLSLALGETNLLLTISGDVGRLHHVLETTNLAAGTWKTNFSLTLTNDPQAMSLPLPDVAKKFWRVLAL